MMYTLKHRDIWLINSDIFFIHSDTQTCFTHTHTHDIYSDRQTDTLFIYSDKQTRDLYTQTHRHLCMHWYTYFIHILYTLKHTDIWFMHSVHRHTMYTLKHTDTWFIHSDTLIIHPSIQALNEQPCIYFQFNSFHQRPFQCNDCKLVNYYTYISKVLL